MRHRRVFAALAARSGSERALDPSMRSLIAASLVTVATVTAVGPHHGAHAAPYTYSAAGTFSAVVEQTSATGTAFVDVGSAKAQTSFGINRAAWQATGQSNPVGALSIWSDQFTITGGTGAGSALMSFGVDGVIGSAPVFEGFFSVLRSASAPSAADLLALAIASVFVDVSPPPGSTVLFYDEGGTPEGDFGPHSSGFSALVSFIYDEPFYLTGAGGGYVTMNGAADFFSSARFGITVPAGATLVTASGTTYAAAVSEPGSIASLAIVLVALGLARRDGLTAGRRRRQ